MKNRIIILLFISLFFVSSASASWYDISWQYKINNVIPDGARPYQISLNISNSTGTNNATTIFCNGHCNVNFTDIRFTLDNTTLLPYWIEDNTTGKVWVNVTATGVVNMYYGNPAATSLSNGNATFIAWHGATSLEFLDTVQSKVTDVAYEAVGRQNNVNSNIWWGMATSLSDTPVDGQFIKQYSTIYYTITYNNSVSSNVNTGSIITAGTYYRMKFTRNVTHLQGYLNNALFMTSLTTNLPDGPMGLGMNFADANTGDQLFSFLRYFSSIEPQWATWQNETVSLTWDNSYTNNNTLSFLMPIQTHILLNLYSSSALTTVWTVDGAVCSYTFACYKSDYQMYYGFPSKSTYHVIANITGLYSNYTLVQWNITATTYNLEALTPVNGSTGVSPNSVTFTWREWYPDIPHTLYIATDDQFINIASTSVISSYFYENSATIIGLLDNTKYYWKVKNNSGYYTNIMNFTTTTTTPTPGRFNITVLDGSNLSKTILNYTLNIYNSTVVITRDSNTTTGWCNLSADEISSGEYLIVVDPTGTFSNYYQRMVLATSPSNVTMYVPNSSAHTIDSVSFSLLDVTGLFPFQTSTITVSRGGLVRDKSYFGMDGTHIVHLTHGKNYQITIQNGNNVQVFDNYVAYATGTSQITINNFSTNYTSLNPFRYNITHTTTDITLNWNDAGGVLSSLNFTVQNQTSHTQVCNLITSIKNGQSVCLINNQTVFFVIFSAKLIDNTFQNTSFIVDYNVGVRKTSTGTSTVNGSDIGTGYIWNYGTWETPNWMYNWISIVLIVILAGSFGGYYSGFGGIVVGIISLIFESVGWFRPLSDSDPNNLITMGITGGLTFLAVIYYLQHKDKGG